MTIRNNYEQWLQNLMKNHKFLRVNDASMLANRIVAVKTSKTDVKPKIYYTFFAQNGKITMLNLQKLPINQSKQLIQAVFEEKIKKFDDILSIMDQRSQKHAIEQHRFNDLIDFHTLEPRDYNNITKFITTK